MQVQQELEQERTLLAEEEDLGNRDGDGDEGGEGLDLGGFGWDEGLGFGVQGLAWEGC